MSNDQVINPQSPILLRFKELMSHSSTKSPTEKIGESTLSKMSMSDVKRTPDSDDGNNFSLKNLAQVCTE